MNRFEEGLELLKVQFDEEDVSSSVEYMINSFTEKLASEVESDNLEGYQKEIIVGANALAHICFFLIQNENGEEMNPDEAVEFMKSDENWTEVIKYFIEDWWREFFPTSVMMMEVKPVEED